jgi:hypothetical protein
MADGAALIARTSQVMKGRWRATRKRHGSRVALQAQLAHIAASEHAGIGGPMRFMTTCARLDADRSMLERERAALVAVALETRCVLATDGAHSRCRQAAVRIVTVAAVNCA